MELGAGRRARDLSISIYEQRFKLTVTFTLPVLNLLPTSHHSHHSFWSTSGILKIGSALDELLMVSSGDLLFCVVMRTNNRELAVANTTPAECQVTILAVHSKLEALGMTVLAYGSIDTVPVVYMCRDTSWRVSTPRKLSHATASCESSHTTASSTNFLATVSSHWTSAYWECEILLVPLWT